MSDNEILPSLSSSTASSSTSEAKTFVYIRDEAKGWVPATLQNRDEGDTVIVECDDGKMKTIKLKDYGPTRQLPLQCINSTHGKIESDLRDLPYLHEANVLYNLKERFEKKNAIYTRAHDRVLIAINPFRWIDGIYAEKERILYADQLVWRANKISSTKPLPPHLYEVSSLAMKGVQEEKYDQTIIVSGESGSGKTVASKIIMSHLATFHSLKKAYVAQLKVEMKEELKKEKQKKKLTALKTPHYIGSALFFVKTTIENSCFVALFMWSFVRRAPAIDREKQQKEENTKLQDELKSFESESFDIDAPDEVKDDDEPEEMKQSNLIVQRVLDSNPLLEAFGNAKTQWNDNSSRFSRHSKLQFDINHGCNIAGSICETFLLEKSRVIGNSKKLKSASGSERTFHIFHQLFEAPETDRTKIWKGLAGKDSSSFKYIGSNPCTDSYTDQDAWKNTIAALHTLGIHGKASQSMLRALVIVMQLGNLTFEADPADPEGSVIASLHELDALSELIGIPSADISRCLTFKTVTAVNDTYSVPLNTALAASTCDAFAKQIYSVLFDWLVERTNDATCAARNYTLATESTKYCNVAALDLFGFECHDENNFEQLLINHSNERLQQSFTENIINSVMKEYESEGIKMEHIDREDNEMVLKTLEGKMGLVPLLNEECIRPRGNDAGFVNKIYANHSTVRLNAPLVFKKKYNLVATQFGIRHFAGVVDYDATGFVEKNRDTLSSDVIEVAGSSTNGIVCRLPLSYQRKSKRKGCLVGVSLWTKFGNQMKELFQTISKTRVTYVRCIVPNKCKEPEDFDLACVLNQLRSVGLLSALKISHASFPNKQTFCTVLQRFWFTVPPAFDARKLRQKYRFGRIPDRADEKEMRKDCDTLLALLFNSLEISEENCSDQAPYIMGKTRVYFRTGMLEDAEKERTKMINSHAAMMQGCVRGWLMRKRLEEGRIDERKQPSTFAFNNRLAPLFVVPMTICRFIFGVRIPKSTNVL